MKTYRSRRSSGAARARICGVKWWNKKLAVLTRLEFAGLLLGQGRPAAVILDDAPAFSDDERGFRGFVF